MWPDLFQVVDADNANVLSPQPSFNLETELDEQTCKLGALLPEGVEQGLAIGQHLRRAYESLLKSLSPENVYVRSMAIPRVLTTTVALMSGILGYTSQLHQYKSYNIRIEGDETIEAMNGGICPRGTLLMHQQSKKLRFPQSIMKILAKLFDVNDFEPYTESVDSAIADVSYTALCDEGVLPCGPGGCINATLHSQLSKIYDQHWCQQYMGDEGGREASQLLMERLLQEIVHRMLDHQHVKFAAYTGRDLVIAPMAAALGFFDCQWPPFASRIVFELWGSRSSSAVRILFDGRPVTSSIPGCGGSELCPLATFQLAVKRLLGGHDSRAEACVVGLHTAAEYIFLSSSHFALMVVSACLLVLLLSKIRFTPGRLEQPLL